jgi:hypothetical protein
LQPAAEILARLNSALADAAIACWEAKYHYNYWRPVTAIRALEGGGADIGWSSLLPAPPHPEYPSGHASFSGAAAVVLAHCFGSDEVRLHVTSVSVPGVTREYRSLSQCADEIASSRVWGGIHFRSAGQAGLSLGRKIGRYAIEKPLPRVPR